MTNALAWNNGVLVGALTIFMVRTRNVVTIIAWYILSVKRKRNISNGILEN